MSEEGQMVVMTAIPEPAASYRRRKNWYHYLTFQTTAHRNSAEGGATLLTCVCTIAHIICPYQMKTDEIGKKIQAGWNGWQKL